MLVVNPLHWTVNMRAGADFAGGELVPTSSSLSRWVSPWVVQCVAFLDMLSKVVLITSPTR